MKPKELRKLVFCLLCIQLSCITLCDAGWYTPWLKKDESTTTIASTTVGKQEQTMSYDDDDTSDANLDTWEREEKAYRKQLEKLADSSKEFEPEEDLTTPDYRESSTFIVPPPYESTKRPMTHQETPRFPYTTTESYKNVPTLDQQCEIMHGKESKAFQPRMHNMLYRMACRSLHCNVEGYIFNGAPALDGSVCGPNHEKCHHGHCFAGDPRSLFCTFGYELKQSYNDFERKMENSCQDINECADGSFTCGINKLCHNTDGSYECVDYPDECSNDEVRDESGECVQKGPTENVLLIELETPRTNKNCNLGFYFNSTFQLCLDIDECEDEEICGNAEVCRNFDGSFECIHREDVQEEVLSAPTPYSRPVVVERHEEEEHECTHGFEWKEGACRDVDECLEARVREHVLQFNATCVNINSSYTYRCLEGFRPYGSGKVGCQDIDECTEGSDECPARSHCINTLGSYNCSCEADMFFSLERKVCLPFGTYYVPPEVLLKPTELVDSVAVTTQIPIPEVLIVKPKQASSDTFKYTRALEEPNLTTARTYTPETYFPQPLERVLTKVERPPHDIYRETHLNKQKTKRACIFGFRFDEASQTCEDIDECAEKLSLCYHGERCINHIGFYFCLPRQ